MNFTVLNFIPAQIAGRRCSRLSFSFRSDSVPNRAVGPSHPTALGSLAGKAARARLALWGPGVHTRADSRLRRVWWHHDPQGRHGLPVSSRETAAPLNGVLRKRRAVSLNDRQYRRVS